MAKKKFRDLAISNAFVFSAVMADEELCRKVIELALGIPIARVHVCTERTMVYHPEYHGIRLDVYAADEDKTRFNIEMQVVFQRYLPRRGRYYHSQLDMDALAAGEVYEKLPDTYVIFICDFDPFGKGLYRYTCRTACAEGGFTVEDGRNTVYLSTRGRNADDVPAELAEFLRYVRASEEKGMTYQSALVKQLQVKVEAVKNDRAMEEKYMLLEEMMRNERKEGQQEGHKKGLLQGRREGQREARKNSILDLLKMKGPVPQKVRAKITKEQDTERLIQWLRLAAQAASVEEFEQKM